MRYFCLSLVRSFFLLGGLFVASLSQATQLPVVLQNALQKAAIPQSAIGLQVIQIKESGSVQPWLSLNANQSMVPASTMKLLTSYAALELLGPAFTWKTRVYSQGTIHDGVLDGDLIIEGGGDAQLVLENFWLLLRKIRMAGVQHIRGNVILDRHLFAEQPSDPADFDDAPSKPYNALPDALLLNYQTLWLRYRPDLIHQNVRLDLDPKLAGYSVYPPALAVRQECLDWRNQLQVKIEEKKIFFAGAFPALCEEKSMYFYTYPIKKDDYFSGVFRTLWAEQGGTLLGTVKEGFLPSSAQLLAEAESKPLTVALYDLNRYSNNVMARHLLLTLAAQNGQIPATTEAAAKIVYDWLATKRINSAGLILENGSGLSRVERISAATLSQLLVSAYYSPYMPELMSSLPIVGVDGSMRKRLVGQAISGQAHIKTGSLNDTKAVAGYVMAASGKRYVVVCFINHIFAARGQEMQNLLLQWIYENG